MPSILHRLSIDAPPARVAGLVATPEGIERWWTGHPVAGGADGRIEVAFDGSGRPAAAFDVVERTPEQVVWRCVDGPAEWVGTRIGYALHPRPGGGTTLLFRHAGWAAETEFMSGCSTNWAAYLISLKAGAEAGEFAPFPRGEMSRWD